MMARWGWHGHSGYSKDVFGRPFFKIADFGVSSSLSSGGGWDNASVAHNKIGFDSQSTQVTKKRDVLERG